MVGRPPHLVQRCQAIRQFLLDQGVPTGKPINRPTWNKLLMRGFNIGDQASRNITTTGEGHGLWVRVPHRGPLPAKIILQ